MRKPKLNRNKRISGECIRYCNQYTPRYHKLITEYFDGMHAGFYIEPYYSDGNYMVLTGDVPKVKKPFRDVESTHFDGVLQAAREVKSTALIFFEICFESDMVLADVWSDDGKRRFFDIKYIDAIMTLHPNSELYMDYDSGLLVFKVNGQVVGALMEFAAFKNATNDFKIWMSTYVEKRYTQLADRQDGSQRYQIAA